MDFSHSALSLWGQGLNLIEYRPPTWNLSATHQLKGFHLTSKWCQFDKSQLSKHFFHGRKLWDATLLPFLYIREGRGGGRCIVFLRESIKEEDDTPTSQMGVFLCTLYKVLQFFPKCPQSDIWEKNSKKINVNGI